MSDTFLPGSGFDTYEEQDKVLVGLCGGRGCRAAVRILQQQGFAVAGAVVRLTDADDTVQAAKDAAKALGIECVTLNASELASQLAEEALPGDLRFPALLAEIGRGYDLVFMDAPDMGRPCAAAALSAADGAVLAVRSCRTRASRAAACAEALRQQAVPLLGIVVTGVPDGRK